MAPLRSENGANFWRQNLQTSASTAQLSSKRPFRFGRFVSVVSFRSFRWFRPFRFGRFVSTFRLLVHAKIKRSKFVNSSILKFFTAIKKIEFKVCILNADWIVVNTRLIFIGCRQECDYSSEKVD